MNSNSSADPKPPTPSLLKCFIELTESWRDLFVQQRTFKRAFSLALGGLICLGRRTITRILWTNGKEQQPWAADYHLFSRAKWNESSLFDVIIRGALPYCKGSVVAAALDDTRFHKTGRCIKQAFYQRDPLSPPFHVNLIYGLRFLQASFLIPSHRKSPRFGARALPVAFQEVSRVKRPGKKASREEIQQWKIASKKHNLSQSGVEIMHRLRQKLDEAGAQLKTLIITADGSFSNRTCFGAVIKRVELLSRVRKSARLCFAAKPEIEGKRRFYSRTKFTPESVRKDPTILEKITRLVYGGKRRKIRYKELFNVYWQGGARRRPLRLITIAPTPYRKRKSSRFYYRQPAYLLTTDLKTSATKLIQIYLDRWEIEINHREEKDTLGVGQAQLWNVVSVPRQPVLAVAAYSALLLAAIKAFGYDRESYYAALPAWRRRARRPSAQDMIALLRKEAQDDTELLTPFGLDFSSLQSVAAAAA